MQTLRPGREPRLGDPLGTDNPSVGRLPDKDDEGPSNHAEVPYRKLLLLVQKFCGTGTRGPCEGSKTRLGSEKKVAFEGQHLKLKNLADAANEA